MQRLSAVLVVMLAGFTATAQGQQDGVTIAWNFKDKKQPFYQTMKTTTSQTMKIMGQDVKQDQTQEFVFSWTVKEADDKKVVLEQKIESVNMTIKIGSQEIKYNSASKEQADNPLASFFKPLVGATFTITLDPKTMKVTAVTGREEFVKKLSEANPQMAKLLQVILGEDQLKQMSEPAFAVVPDGPVKPKATWERTSKLSMGPIGSYDAKFIYTYVGTVKKKDAEGKDVTLERIDVKTELTYKAPEGAAQTGLSFKIEGGTLKTTDASGTIWFDKEKGRVAETTMKIGLDGNLDISVADQKAQVTLKQEQTTTTTTTDKNPVEGTK
jgi:hypothetical protein